MAVAMIDRSLETLLALGQSFATFKDIWLGGVYKSDAETRQEEAGEDGDEFDSVWIVVFFFALCGILRASIIVAGLYFFLGSLGGGLMGRPM